MSETDPRKQLTNIFYRLRQRGFKIGIDELLSAIRLFESRWGAIPEQFKQAMQLLWCKTKEELRNFEEIWEPLLSDASDLFSQEEQQVPEEYPFANQETPLLSETSDLFSQEEQQVPEEYPFANQETPQKDLLQAPGVQGAEAGYPEQLKPLAWRTLPIRAPATPTLRETPPVLDPYWPISRRFMVYSWRYLRRIIADGPTDVLDIPATIERVSKQGFFLTPTFRNRERNRTHLILFLDQGGSMVPFHHFTRQIVDTAQYESSLEQVEIFYFHNIPNEYVYSDPYLTSRVALSQVLGECSTDTSVLVVSDAGAARGYRQLPRIRETTRFLHRLKQRTRLAAWLNPMPEARWSGSSAQIIANLLPMFQMDADGFSNAINVVRGQPLQHYR